MYHVPESTSLVDPTTNFIYSFSIKLVGGKILTEVLPPVPFSVPIPPNNCVPTSHDFCLEITLKLEILTRLLDNIIRRDIVKSKNQIKIDTVPLPLITRHDMMPHTA
jgi:hypothetical protein